MFGAHPMFRIGGAAGYQIPYSLRFRASNSAYLSRTPASAGNRKTATISIWFKRGGLSATMDAVGVNAANTEAVRFTSGNAILVRFGNLDSTSNALFRDPSGWGHLVIARDTTQATSTDRLKAWWNGTLLTWASYSVPAQNADTDLFNNVAHYIGASSGPGNIFDGYMAEVNFIDGQALTPSSFGQTDATTGVWVPKQYAGTYGSNGFYLKFADATTTTTIGNDSSSNGNNWTTSGISVTSGVTFDQMTDTPTLNYTVWNFLDKASTVTLSDANLKASGTTINSLCRSSIAMPLSGKWYMEFVPDANGLDDIIGVATAVASMGEHLGFNASGWGFQPNLSSSVYKYNGSGTGTVVTGTAFSSNDVGMLAVDVDNSKLWLGRNGTWYESGNPATGANAQFTNLSTTLQLFFAITPGRSGSGETTANFGQRAFAYTPPTGFKALSTQNVTSTSVTVSGSFTGNASADGPFIWANGNPATLTINGNAVTFGTDADKTAGGFKLRTSSASYNAAGTNNWTATAGNRFVQARKPNNAQVNP
jgi:hypothetical protein